MLVLYRIISLVIGYCFGLFQTGYILGRLKGVDIRQYGSGNSGTTNASRVLGKKAGIMVYVGDCLKALICCIIIRIIFGGIEPDLVGLLVLYAGFGVVLGHNYPFYMNFKGGKGIAATSGAVLAFGDWRIIVICLAVFISFVFITKYMSLASLAVVTSFLLCMLLFGQFGHIGLAGSYVHEKHLLECYVVALAFTASAFFQHRENIVRLVHGTERKLGDPKEDVHIEDMSSETHNV